MTIDVTALSIQVQSTGIREASNALGGLSVSARNTEQRINSLVEAMKKLQGVSSTFNVVGGTTAGLTAAINALNNTLNLLNQRTTQADQTQRRHNESMREAHALARGLSGSLGALWLTYGNFAGMAVGLAIGTSLKGIVTVGKDVEHTLEGIRIKGQETVGTIDEMRKAIFDLGKGVYGPQQVATALETLVLAGLDGVQALNSVNAAINLAIVGGTTIEKSAQTLVSVGTAIGFVAEGYDRVADVIAKTAALSMSSVASLSEAFKSGSSVNKLYGVSLEDIATNLGVLSNLGIQGSAAGTAMKNFYKELAAGNSKVNDTFKAMKISASDLKDSTTGNFLPLLEVVEKLAKGMSNLTVAQQKLALANLTNERGMRLAVQLLGEYNTKTGESSNALKEFRKNVEDSYGFAAIGAVAMSLTAKNQIESMINTLKVTFAEVFTKMQPEIIAFTGRMKGIFASDEFKNGIRLLAQTFANLAVAIANNLPLITNLILGFTALKVLIAAGTMWTAAAAGINAMSIALRGAATAGALLTASLGPIAILLGVVTAAILLYNNAQEDSNKHTKMAEDYSKGYLEGLREEEVRLGKVNKKLQEKMTLTEANAAIVRGDARDEMIKLNNKAIAEAQDKLDNGIKWTGYTKIEQQKELNRLKKKAIDDLVEEEKRTNSIKNIAKENAAIVKKQSDDNKKVTGGDGDLDIKIDKAKINDAYQAAVLKQMEDIKSAKKELAAYEKQQNSEYKMGLIDKLALVERVNQKEIESFIKAQTARREALSVAKAKGNVTDVTRYEAEIQQAREDLDAKNVQAKLDSEEEILRAVREYSKYRVDVLESEGSFQLAAVAKWEYENGLAFKRAEAAAEKYGKVLPVLVDRLNQMKEARDAAFKGGKDKDIFTKLSSELSKIKNQIREVTANSDEIGLADIFNAATEASKNYYSKIEELKKRSEGLTDKGSKDKIAEEITNTANAQRKMWISTSEIIGKSLESAFGKGGRAAGDLMSIATKYFSMEKVTSAQRIKGYGDAAGAAKGFFKEGTTGYKVMEGAEKAFRALELANMAKSIIASNAASIKKAIGKIPEFLMGWGSMGPWGYAAGAVAIAAILGSFSGGGGSAPERVNNEGKGSVLGDKDAKSDSIAKSLAIMEKNSGLGLVHSSSMVKSLNVIADSIGNLAQMLVRSSGLSGDMPGNKNGAVGDAIRKSGSDPATMLLDKLSNGLVTKISDKIANFIFGGKITALGTGLTVGKESLGSVMSTGATANQYTDFKKDGGLFHSDKYTTELKSLGVEVDSQFTKVIVGLGESIKAAGEILGIGGDAFTKNLESFVVDIGSIDLKGLSGTEIQEKIQAIFSKLGDDMAKFGVAGLDKFQKIGEGYFETLSRVANDLIQVKDVFAVLSKSFSLTGLDAVEVSESLILAAGSLEKLTSGTKFFVDNFLTEAEKMAPITASVTNRLSELGASELTTIELYKKKIQSLDLTNKADQEMYANLLALAPAFKESADYATRLAEGVVELTAAQKKAKDILDKQHELDIRLLEAQGKSLEAVAARRSDELAALTLLSPALATTQQAIYDAEDATKALDKATQAANAQRTLELRMLDAQGDAAGSLAAKRADELAAMAKVNPELVEYLKSIYATEDATKAAQEAEKEAAKLKDVSTKQRSLEIELLKALGFEQEAIDATRKDELAALAAISPVLAEYQQAIYLSGDAAAKAAADLAKSTEDASARRSLEIQLMEAQGNAAGALAATRADELEALRKAHPELVETQKAIYMMTDSLALANSRRGLEIELMEAQGNVIGATKAKREDELKALAAINPALAATKKTIYDLVDAAELKSRKDSLELELMDAQGNSLGANIVRRNAEIEALNLINPLLGALQQRVYEASDALLFSNKSYEIHLELLGAMGADEMVLAENRKNELAALNAINPTLVTLKQAVYDAQDAAKETAKALEISNTKHSLEIELMKALGNESGALAATRKDELDALRLIDPALADLKQSIFSAVDAAAELDKTKAAQEALQATYKSLQDEIDGLVKASMPLAEQRALELVGLDETATALKKRIFALQDESAAVAAANEVAAKAAELAKAQRGLDIQLMEAQGNASGALAAQRLDELAALDASLRGTQLAIYAALDKAKADQEAADIAKAAADKIVEIAKQRTSFEIQIMELQGKTLEATAANREIELAALDESLRPLQQRIYNLQDEAKATELANAAITKAAEIAKTKHSMEIELMEAQGKSVEALVIKRADELSAMDASLKATQLAIWAALDKAKADEEIANLAKAAADKAIELAKQKSDLTIRILELEGKSVEALAAKREIELASMDVSLVNLQSRIYALEDEAEASRIAKEASEKASALAKQKTDLEIQIMELEGKSVEALAAKRAIELSALDSSLIPLQNRIYVLQDEAKAAEIANAAITKAAEIAKAQRGLDIQLLEAQGKSVEALAAKRTDELGALDESLKATQLNIWATLDKAEADKLAAAEVETAANKALEIAKQKTDLSIRIMELEGKSSEALAAKRVIELAALDTSLKSLQERIYALEDEAEASRIAKEASEKALQLAKAQRSLDIQLMEAQGNAAGALAATRADELAAMDETLRVTQLAIYTALDKAKADEEAANIAKETADKVIAIAKERSSLEIEIMELEGNALGAIEAKRSSERAAMDASLIPLQERIWSLQDEATVSARASALAAQQRSLDIQLMEALGNSTGALTAKREDELKALDVSLQATQLAIYAAIDKAKADAEAAEASRLASEAYARWAAEQQAAMDAAIQAAEEAAKKVAAIYAQRVDLELRLGELMGDTTAALAAKRALELQAMDSSLWALQQQIWMYEDQAESIVNNDNAISKAKSDLSTAYDKEASAIKSTIDKTKDYIKSLKDLRDSMLLGGNSTLDPLGKYNEAKRQLENATPENFSAAANAFLEASRGYFATSTQYTSDFNYVMGLIESSIGSSTSQLDIAQTQLDLLDRSVQGLMDINESVLSVEDAIRELAGLGIANITANPSGFIDGSHAGGLDSVPFDGYVAKLHKGERVRTASGVANDTKTNAELIELTKELLAKVSEVSAHGAASVNVAVATAEMTQEAMARQAEKLDKLSRGIAAK